jgi:hypothetical protein
MTDQELRALVRDAVARHLGRTPPAPPSPVQPIVRAPGADAPAWRAHPSHGLYITLVNVGESCVIEPSVSCDHCGYCKSHGH